MKKPSAVQILFILILSIYAALFMKGDGLMLYGEKIPGSSPDVDLSFAVLGDVHDNGAKFEAAVHDLYRSNQHMDALILNGDAVDQGIQKQYEEIQKIIRENKYILPEIIIKNIGNHEYYNYSRGNNSEADVKNCIKAYLEFSGEKNVYHDTWIKGYHFISLGSEEDSTKRAGAVKAYLFEEQLKWLKLKLAEKYEPGKPIFVFLHQHLISNTRSWIGVEQKEKVVQILNQYPEAIVFTSHTHISLERDNILQQNPFFIVHTGAVANIYRFYSNGSIERVNDSQGVYVEVHKNKVVINGRDFKNKKWIFSKEIEYKNK